MPLVDSPLNNSTIELRRRSQDVATPLRKCEARGQISLIYAGQSIYSVVCMRNMPRVNANGDSPAIRATVPTISNTSAGDPGPLIPVDSMRLRLARQKPDSGTCLVVVRKTRTN